MREIDIAKKKQQLRRFGRGKSEFDWLKSHTVPINKNLIKIVLFSMKRKMNYDEKLGAKKERKSIHNRFSLVKFVCMRPFHIDRCSKL